MKKILKYMILLFLTLVVVLVGAYFYLISAPSKDSKEVTFTVSEGQTYSTIGKALKEKGLIRNEIAYKIYIKLNKVGNLEYGSYTLNTNYNIKKMLEIFSLGSTSKGQTVTVTFKEGLNMRKYIDIISENFDYTQKDVLDKLSDKEYLDTIINKYWFLTEEIKNKNIYYSLEGYLYPDTYEFYKTASIEDIFKVMLDNMDKKLTNYKEEIESSKYTIHQMITLSSIIELEAGNSNDRKGVAGVFYNRLENNWSLGSDVTTYYAAKVDLSERDLYKSELNDCNSYNTRAVCMAGKLPVGPICNPSIKSIEASIEPEKHNYYYFVADKNGKTYFNKTDGEHTATVNKLKKDGLWFEY